MFATAGLLPGRRRPGPHAEPGRHRPAAVPPPGRPAAVGPPRAARRGRVPPDRHPAGGDDAGPGGRAADPHRRPTAASSPCSTAGSARPATAGTSCGRCRRCGAPATGPRSRRSWPGSSPDRRRAPGSAVSCRVRRVCPSLRDHVPSDPHRHRPSRSSTATADALRCSGRPPPHRPGPPSGPLARRRRGRDRRHRWRLSSAAPSGRDGIDGRSRRRRPTSPTRPRA